MSELRIFRDDKPAAPERVLTEGNAIADALSDLFLKDRCHAGGHCARCNAAWLEHEDPSPLKPRRLQQKQRH